MASPSDEIIEQSSAPEVSQIETHFNDVIETLGTFRQTITALQASIRTIEKLVKKDMKVLKKEASKVKTRGNRKPSGFARPSKITPELCKFMGRDEGTEIARTEVTQYLIQYIKTHDLQFADNKKIILPDKPLTDLLGPEEGEEVTYFNIQRFMNKHFIKKESLSEPPAI